MLVFLRRSNWEMCIALSRMPQPPPRASSVSWMSRARTTSTRTNSLCRLRCRRQRSERLRSVRPKQSLDQAAACVQTKIQWALLGIAAFPLMS